jgi:hypothetical protein
MDYKNYKTFERKCYTVEAYQMYGAPTATTGKTPDIMMKLNLSG